MKLLFGLAVAILVLATTLEVVNAGPFVFNCPSGYTKEASGKFCYRVGNYNLSDHDYAQCHWDGGRLSTAAELDMLAGIIAIDHYRILPGAGQPCVIGEPGSAVSAPMSCIPDIVYKYVCVIRLMTECPHDDFCIRGSGTGGYNDANDACEEKKATVTTAAQLDLLVEQLDPHSLYWIQGTDERCQVAAPGGAQDNPKDSNCSDNFKYVCVSDRDLEDNDDCICTLHDDPLVNSCDNATIMIIGEEQWYRFTASDEYAACAFEVDFYLGVDQALEKMYVKLKNKEIWMYADGIREDNENAALKLYTDGNPLVDLPMTDMTGVVYSGDITVSYDAAENLATYESEHCEIKLEFRTSPKPILRATIGEKYDNDLKWLCGNFNDNTEDDYRNENGDIISNEPDRYIQISDYVKKNTVAMT